MPASTAEELGEDLDGSIQWRKIEMAAIRSQVARIPLADVSKPLSRALLRAGSILLYAHWEGFTKDACQGYLDYVARRKMKLGELSDEWVSLAVRRIGRASVHGDPTAVEQLVELVRRGPEVRARVPRSGVVETSSNLRHAVLMEILGALGLPSDTFETRAQLIDRSLCDRRNDIAHGRENFPSQADFLEMHGHVIGMLDEVRDLILAAARMGSYRRVQVNVSA